MDPATAAALFRLTDRELWLVTAAAGPRQGGLIATFVCHASLPTELPRVLIAIARHHQTWQLIEESRCFALHLIGEGQLELVWRFGLASGRDIDKFAGLEVQRGTTGSPLLQGALGWVECRVEAGFDTGDRTAWLAEVIEARLERRDRPLSMQRLLELAPPDKLQELRRQREHDALLDAEAIRAWRCSLHIK
jgi:flavin reductase (DIM6/NTAB) family NADH-FMN oxidoreductase RutF